MRQCGVSAYQWRVLVQLTKLRMEHGIKPPRERWDLIAKMKKTTNDQNETSNRLTKLLANNEIPEVDVPKTMPEPEPDGDVDHDYDGSRDEEEDEPIDSLIQRRQSAFVRKMGRWKQHKPKTVSFRSNLPIAIAHVGDPHLDDDGCDWIQLKYDLELIRNTEGMYGGCLGDVTNSWVGRLVRLWAKQTSTHQEEVRLGQWFFEQLRWLYVVNGNHDDWHPDSFKRMVQNSEIDVMAAVDGRIVLTFPNSAMVKIHARHTFKGTSIYNPLHGQKRASLWDPWARRVCGRTSP